jgi:hypothetical protein
MGAPPSSMVAAIETTASTTEMSEAEATTERAVRRGSEFSGALERPEPPSQARHTGQPPLPLALDRPDLYKSALLKKSAANQGSSFRGEVLRER